MFAVSFILYVFAFYSHRHYHIRGTISALVRIVDDICMLYMKSVGTEIFGRGAGKACDIVCDETRLRLDSTRHTHTRRANKVEEELRREKGKNASNINISEIQWRKIFLISFRFVPFRLLHVCLYVTSVLLLLLLLVLLLLVVCVPVAYSEYFTFAVLHRHVAFLYASIQHALENANE